MEVILATKQKHFADAFKIRTQVFIGEQNVPAFEEIDELDCYVPIFLAYNQDNYACATARVIFVDNSLAKIGRVAVDLQYRRKGVGKILMEGLHQYIKDHSTVKKIKLSAQLTAVPFYKTLGYVASGDVYLDAGIEHIDMIKKLDLDPS